MANQPQIDRVYVSKIAPLIDQITKICKKHNICMLAAFAVPLNESGSAGVVMLNKLPNKDKQLPPSFNEAARIIEGTSDAAPDEAPKD